MAQGRTVDSVALQVLAAGDVETLCRPCVDCGLKTGRFCDYCYAEDRLPGEKWANKQLTPLCSTCDNRFDKRHFCRGLKWCTPPTWARRQGSNSSS